MITRVEMAQLRYFVAVAEEASFSRGAAREHVVQSAASAAVARLEHEVGQALLVRSGRSVVPTAAGSALLARAHSILGQVASARDELDLFTGGLRGVVTLGTLLSTGTLDLPAALSGFRRAHPDVAVHLRHSARGAEDHLRAVVDGRFDLLLAPHPAFPSPGVRLDPVGRMRMVLACRVDDPLAGAASVTYRQLSGRTFVDFPERWGNRRIVDALFGAAGASRAVGVEVVDVATALRLVRAGLGLAFVPSESLDGVGDLTAVDLRDPPPWVTLALAVAADRPMAAATAALRSVLLEHSGGTGEPGPAERATTSTIGSGAGHHHHAALDAPPRSAKDHHDGAGDRRAAPHRGGASRAHQPARRPGP